MPSTTPAHPMQKAAAVAALHFVYPDLRMPPQAKVTPDVAGLAFVLARAVDSTSRVTYGLFNFYAGLLPGMAGRSLAWTDIPLEVAHSVKAAVEDGEPKRNLLVTNFIHMKYPQRLIERHLSDPDTFPLPELRIDRTSRLDRLIFRIED